MFGLDATAGQIFAKVVRLAESEGVQLVWAGLSPKIMHKFAERHLLDGHPQFKTLDEAEKYVEDALLEHVHKLSQRWLVDNTCRLIYNRAMLHDALTAHAVSDGSIGPSQLFKWALKKHYKKGETIFEEGEQEDSIFLIYLGKIELNSYSPPQTMTAYPGAFFNEHVLYNGHTSRTLYSATAMEDTVVLRVTHELRQEMQWHDAHTAYQLVLAAFRQAELRQPHRRHPTHAKPENAQTLDHLERSSLEELANDDELHDENAQHHTMRSREVNQLRKVMAHGDAIKKNSTYSKMLVKVHATPLHVEQQKNAHNVHHSSHGSHGFHMPHLHMPHLHMPHLHMPHLHMLHMPHMPHIPHMPHMPHLHMPHMPHGLHMPHLFHHDKHPSEHSTRMEGHDVEQGVSPDPNGHGPAFRPYAEAVEAVDATELKFEEAASFNGPKEGYIFKSGPKGLGYYEDRPGKFKVSVMPPPPPPAAAPGTEPPDDGNLHWVHAGRPHEDMRHEAILDRDFLYGHDFKVPLTKTQNDHYSLIFKLNDATDSGHLKVSELSNYMYSLGHGVSVDELEEMMHAVGIDEDQDGTITEADFLEFMRRENVANLPSRRIGQVQKLFQSYHDKHIEEQEQEKAEAALEKEQIGVETEEHHHMRLLHEAQQKQDKEHPVDTEDHITRAHTMKLMHDLGFELDDHTFDEVFLEVDSRGDGTVTLNELITAVSARTSPNTTWNLPGHGMMLALRPCCTCPVIPYIA